MSKKKPTTRDCIQIDLDGSIDEAIATLTELKAEHPRGKISLETDYEYGESYARLYLRFERPKEPAEIEIDKWRDKLSRLGELRNSAHAFAAEGQAYPRAEEIAALEAELGAWAKGHRSMGGLIIFEGEVLFNDMMRGAYRRDGTWVFRTMMADRYDAIAQGTSPGTAETGTGSGA